MADLNIILSKKGSVSSSGSEVLIVRFWCDCSTKKLGYEERPFICSHFRKCRRHWDLARGNDTPRETRLLTYDVLYEILEASGSTSNTALDRFVPPWLQEAYSRLLKHQRARIFYHS